MAASRIQRWLLILSSYQYTIQHHPGSKMASADALSRLPLSDLPAIESNSGEIDLLYNQLSEAIVTASQIKAWTKKDPLLSRVHVLHGWTVTNPDTNLQPYFNCCDELSVTDGCVLWGSHVIVPPPPGRDIILKQLHDTCTMLGLSLEGFVWWETVQNHWGRCLST